MLDDPFLLSWHLEMLYLAKSFHCPIAIMPPIPHTHTHTQHTHTHVHTYTQHTHAHTACTYTHTYTRTLTHIHTCIHTHGLIHTHTHAPLKSFTTFSLPHCHTYTLHTYTLIHTYTHTHTHTHSYTHIPIRTHTHAFTHTPHTQHTPHTHALIHTHTHTHTYFSFVPVFSTSTSFFLHLFSVLNLLEMFPTTFSFLLSSILLSLLSALIPQHGTLEDTHYAQPVGDPFCEAVQTTAPKVRY